jgi:hypothetical protein
MVEGQTWDQQAHCNFLEGDREGGFPGPSIPVQTSPASSLWSQLLRPQGLRGQSRRACSPPPHPTSSIHTGPEPGPNLAPPGAASAPPQPSSRQATVASRRSHPSSHTVPQRPPCQTSRRPAQPWGPETRRSRSVGGKEGGREGGRGHV